MSDGLNAIIYIPTDEDKKMMMEKSTAIIDLLEDCNTSQKIMIMQVTFDALKETYGCTGSFIGEVKQ